jgi:transcriptional regulator with XRE-family HTH domain
MKTNAEKLRALLEKLELSQRAAARDLEISERMMRYYCSGEHEVPRVVMLALERLLDLKSS